MKSTRRVFRPVRVLAWLGMVFFLLFPHFPLAAQTSNPDSETVYLLIDSNAVIKETLENIRDYIRVYLRENRIAYSSPSVIENQSISFRPTALDGAGALENYLLETMPELKVTRSGRDITISLRENIISEIQKDAALKTQQLFQAEFDRLGIAYDRIEEKTPNCVIAEAAHWPRHLFHNQWQISFSEITSRFATEYNQVSPSERRVVKFNKDGIKSNEFVMVKKRARMSGDSIVQATHEKGWREDWVRVQVDWVSKRRLLTQHGQAPNVKLAIIADDQFIALPDFVRLAENQTLEFGPFARKDAEHVTAILQAGRTLPPFTDDEVCEGEKEKPHGDGFAP